MTPETDFYIYNADELADRPITEGVTIDGPVSLDMDDGISLCRDGGSWHINVSIADVASCDAIAKGTPADKQARTQGMSRYHDNFNQWQPMLPPEYAYNKLSLVEGLARPAITITTVLDDTDLRCTSFDVRRTAFINRKKFDYAEIPALARDGHEMFRDGIELTRRLARKHIASGGEPSSYLNKPHGEGDLLIEQMMLLANETAAIFSRQNNIPVIFRNSERTRKSGVRPDAWKEKLLQMARTEFPQMAPNIEDRIFGKNKVSFATISRGHNVLGITDYMQITSPLRRYIDLFNQRQLGAFLAGNPYPYSEPEREKMARANPATHRTPHGSNGTNPALRF